MQKIFGKLIARKDNEIFGGGRAGSDETPQYRLQYLNKATNKFSHRNMIGKGGNGIVYKGQIDGQIVAIKELVGRPVQLLEDIVKEIRLIYSLRNDNLIKFLGFCIEDRRYLLVYEYISHGNLHKWLTDETKRRSLNRAKRFKIIKGIARGLLYLHRNAVIHLDIKPENILLDENYNAKIADFGISKIFDTKSTHKTTKKSAGTFGYISPELYEKQQYSDKSDVFSYGILILEILAGSTIKEYAQANSEVLSHFDKGPHDRTFHYILIGLHCVQYDPKERPTMEGVMKMLNTKDPLPEPSVPPFFQEHVRFEDTRPEGAEHPRLEDPSTSVEVQHAEHTRPKNAWIYNVLGYFVLIMLFLAVALFVVPPLLKFGFYIASQVLKHAFYFGWYFTIAVVVISAISSLFC